MKILSIVLPLLLLLCPTAHHLTAGPLTGEKAIQHLKDTGQYESLAAAMTGARYGVKAADGAVARALAPNPAHGLRSTFTREGVRLEVRSGEATHQVDWRLQSLGYGAAQIAVPPGELKVSRQHVEIVRGPSPTPHSALATPQLVEWFNNTPGGLEHGFTLAERPATNSRGEPLRLVLTVTGDLAPQADATGQNLLLRDAAGQSVLTYEKLKVWDAAGAELPATMQVADGKVTLTVQEANAHYPLTIDPTFVQQAYLKASNTGAGDIFGSTVAVSGDTVVIGAQQEDSGATGVNGVGSETSFEAGAAYVFVRSGATWTQQAYLQASNAEDNDLFGQTVAISGDTVVVGAYRESGSAIGVNGPVNEGARSAGAAYVFVRSGTTWAQQAYLKASNTGSGDLFGVSVAVSGDTVVVGAPSEDSSATGVNSTANELAGQSGAAYVFVRSGTTWSQQAYLKASQVSESDNFGFSVAVAGNTVVVGAPFEDSSATGVNGTADELAGDAGAAYVFVRSGTTWSQQAYLKASQVSESDNFGGSVAVAGDTVVVGALSEDGSAAGVNGTADELSGQSGAAYCFVRSGTTWTQQAYLKASNTGKGDRFGKSVAVAGDTVVVGATSEDGSATGVNSTADELAGQSGAAYCFVRSGTTWTQQAYLKASNTGANDGFGASVAVSGDTVVVGALAEGSGATGINGNQNNNSAFESGAVYVFTVSDPCPVVADPAGPFTDTVGPIKPFVVLRENEALAGSQMIGAPSVVGFNDASQLALLAVQPCAEAGAPGNNYLLRLTLGGSGPLKELSSFAPSLERTNLGLGLRDDGRIISFDSFDSPNNEDPPIVNGRIWQGASFTLLPAALREVGEEIAFGGEVKARAVSANGNFYVVSISRNGGRETVLLNGQGTALQTFPNVVPIEPIQISDAGQFLGAPASNPANIHVYQPNGPAIQIGDPVQHIRLSRDGTALARLDKLTGQTRAFVLQVANSAGGVAATVINPSASDTFVDSFETWRGTQNGLIQSNQIIGGVRRFLDVLAVQRLKRPLGDQIMTVIEAEDTAGVAGLYYIRSSARSGKVHASGKIPRITGLAYPDTTGHSAGSDAFLNRQGEILVQDSTPVFDKEGGVTGQSVVFSILHANTLTKFKQNSHGSLLTGLAANPETRWFDQPVNPNLPIGKRKKFGAVGCTLTSMATIASFYGMEISPLEVRDIMLSLGAINDKNATTVSKFRLTAGNKTLKRTGEGETFADIVSELRGGNAVLLKVPNKKSSAVATIKVGEDINGKDILVELPPLADGSYRFNGKGHYIVAYGLNPSLAPASAVTAADILISDPAYSYQQVYATAYTAGEELVHVTLADYFGRIAADPDYFFDVREWFDHNRFHRATGELVNAAEPAHIQRWRLVEGSLPPEPSIDVFSPVELAITANGKRYVSAPALARAGDILLERIAPDNIGAFDEENDTGTGADEPFDEFPPYTLLLPPELAGVSLDFEILGIGSGSYKIVLNPAKPGFESTSFLSGNTALGQTQLGRINVVAAKNTFTDWAAGFPALGNQNGFSDDPDGDGINNGFERFLGTHPLETSAGLTLTAGSTIAGFQHTRSKFPGTDVVAVYEWSTNLTEWHPSGETVAGVSVTLTAVVIATTATTETVAITPSRSGAPSVLFYRLRLQLLE